MSNRIVIVLGKCDSNGGWGGVLDWLNRCYILQSPSPLSGRPVSDWRKALFASLVSPTPDLDVLFSVHRSESHSLILLTIVVVPLLILTRKHKALRTYVLLGTL